MQRAKVKFDPILDMLTVDGLVIDVDIVAAIMSAPARVLWRFEVVDGGVVATPYDERHVIFMDKESAESKPRVPVARRT